MKEEGVSERREGMREGTVAHVCEKRMLSCNLK